MADAPPRLLVALIQGVIRLQPADHRRRYGPEQMRMFEEIWARERPSSATARLAWSIGLAIRTLFASLGVRRDARRAAALTSGRFRTGGSPMSTDIRFTLRALRQAPWLPATVAGVIAVTLALATTVFAVVDGVLFRPLPYPDASALVRVEPAFRTSAQAGAGPGTSVAVRGERVDLEQWRAAVPGLQITGFRRPAVVRDRHRRQRRRGRRRERRAELLRA